MANEFKNAGILGIGFFRPEEVILNSHWDDKELLNLPSRKKKEDCFIGIKERRFFPKDMIPSDAEVEAGKLALQNAGVKPEEIDLVLMHSMVPDEIIPGNASLVQHKLGLNNSAAWNLDTCCSSFVTMTITASNLIACGTFKKVLIITSIFHSKIVDENDYLSTIIGDGASAIVMGEVPEGYGYISSKSISNGYFHDAFTIRERLPLAASHRSHLESSPAKNFMTTNPQKTREMGRKSIDYMTPVMLETLEKSELDASDIDFFFSHQPCHWAHDAWRESLNLTKDKSLHTFGIYGNLASTSIPASMYHAVKENKLKKGDLILIASSGAGENHTAATFRWAI